MTKINLGQTIQILANLGVIAGIVFLGIELQQNNAVLGAQARASRAQFRIDSLSARATNPELLGAYLKQRNGEPLTAMDQLLLDLDAARVLTVWQYVYGEVLALLCRRGSSATVTHHVVVLGSREGAAAQPPSASEGLGVHSGDEYIGYIGLLPDHHGSFLVAHVVPGGLR